MNERDLEKLRRQLIAFSSRVRDDALALVEQSRHASGGNAGSELSNAPFHLGDMGTEEFLHDLNTTLLANEQFIVSEAREALVRLEESRYGHCENCGRSIVKARLEAIPYTRYCVACAETLDATPQVNLNEGRPQSPRDTLAPEGEMEENRPRRVDPMETPHPQVRRGDVHAVGTAGGGTPIGGLAGGTEGSGEPAVSQLDEATGSSYFDSEDDRDRGQTPMSGRSGGAVGGTPVFKRSK